MNQSKSPQMINEDWQKVFAALKKEQRRERRASLGVRFRIFASFVITFVICVLRFYQGLDANAWWSLVDLLFVAIAVWLLVKGLRDFDTRFMQSSHIVTMSPEGSEYLGEVIEKMKPALGDRLGKIIVRLNLLDRSVVPSTVKVYGMEYLLVPIGFFKLLTDDPEAAKAIIFHELAHVWHEDSRLWVLASTYANVIRRILVPFNGVLLAISFIATIITLTNIPIIERAQENLRDYEEIHAEQRRNLVGSYFGSVGHPSLYSNLGGSLVEQDAFDQLKNMDPVAMRLESILTAMLGLFGFVVPILFYYGVRKRRRRSEELADVAAMLFGGVRALSRALGYCAPSSPAKWKLFSIHPSISQRRQRIEMIQAKYPGLLAETASGGIST